MFKGSPEHTLAVQMPKNKRANSEILSGKNCQKIVKLLKLSSYGENKVNSPKDLFSLLIFYSTFTCLPKQGNTICFTSSLNIVGEKNFACMACREPVKDFQIYNVADLDRGSCDPPVSIRSGSNPPPTQAFPTAPNTIRPEIDSSAPTVLRLDNVPWVRASLTIRAMDTS